MTFKTWLIMAVLCILLIFMITSIVRAETISTQWTYDVAQEASITGFRIYDKDNNIVVDNIPAADRTASFEAGEVCSSWYITAVNVSNESKNSNIISWCPELIRPTTFEVTTIE